MEIEHWVRVFEYLEPHPYPGRLAGWKRVAQGAINYGIVRKAAMARVLKDGEYFIYIFEVFDQILIDW